MARKDWKPYRKEKLIAKGFLPFEAEYYSQFPISHLGIRKIIRFRQRNLSQAVKSGIPSSQIPNYILSSYRAKDLIDDKGKPDADMYNSALFRQLEKPTRDRQSLLISPDRYTVYKQLTGIKISSRESVQIAELVPQDQLPERLEMYRKLIHAHYSSSEAAAIVTATTPDSTHREVRLQNLDLDNPAWQTAMEERINWFNKQVKINISRRMTPQQARRAAIREVQDWYEKDIHRTPWDEIEDISPSGPTKPEVDFDDALRRRKEKQRKEKMPWEIR